MNTSVRANVAPELLRWARVTAGFNIEDAARKIQVSLEKLVNCEEGNDQLTFNQLKLAADVYKRPLAVFFLDEVPPREPAVHDFRMAAEVRGHELSPQVNIELRRARQRRDEAIELAKELGRNAPEFALAAKASEDPESIAIRITKALGHSADVVDRWRSNEEALKGRKAQVEHLGALVFEASRIPTEVMCGASLWFPTLPIVVLNGGDAHARRSFTLFHELAHLLLRNGGLCDLVQPLVDSPAGVMEHLCNSIAAAALMPRESLLQRVPRQLEWTLEDLGQLAEPYRVSREAMMVRLLSLGRASQRQYDQLKPQFREEYLRFKASQHRAEKKAGGPSPAVMAVRNLGRPFVRLVLDAYEDDHIDLSTVSDYLGVKVRHVTRIKELSRNGEAAA